MNYYSNCKEYYGENDQNRMCYGRPNAQFGEFENNSWNYYPETDEKFEGFENSYQQENYDYGKFDKCDNNDGYGKTMSHRQNCRLCFFPCFPCFRNSHRNNCKESRPCYDRDEWKCGKPCYDRDCHKRPCQETRGNRFYFSGCIEINKFDRK